MSYTLAAALGLVAIGSIWFSPRALDTAGFFRGTSSSGAAPGLLTLVFSQVTTWVFARSLMNAAILGYFYGAAGTIAYAAYYLSFLNGAWIIDAIRFKHGFDSVQSFLDDRYGQTGGSSSAQRGQPPISRPSWYWRSLHSDIRSWAGSVPRSAQTSSR
jgi:Na+/proline symporter